MLAAQYLHRGLTELLPWIHNNARESKEFDWHNFARDRLAIAAPIANVTASSFVVLNQKVTFMTNSLLTQAKTLGFNLHRDPEGKLWILPRKKTDRWKLLELEEGRWLLIVGNVPQISFWPREAQLFLFRRRSSLKPHEKLAKNP